MLSQGSPLTAPSEIHIGVVLCKPTDFVVEEARFLNVAGLLHFWFGPPFSPLRLFFRRYAPRMKYPPNSLRIALKPRSPTAHTYLCLLIDAIQ